MLREHFLGRQPSHFLKTDPIVKAFIVSECFFCSGWNFITPLFAIFVVENVTRGSIEAAAGGYSIFLISRVVFELICGRFFAHASDRKKLAVVIFGFFIISLAYLGFAFSKDILQIFIFYIILGAGIGLSTPAKNSVFSVHLDKNKEATEWSIADATSAICMALSTALGGFIAATYGFQALFLVGFFVNFLSIIPYALYIRRRPSHQ